MDVERLPIFHWNKFNFDISGYLLKYSSSFVGLFIHLFFTCMLMHLFDHDSTL